MAKVEDSSDTNSPLRRLRVARGISLRKLSAETGIPVSRLKRLEDPSLTRIEKYAARPRVLDLVLLAWAFDVKAETLVDSRWLGAAAERIEQPSPFPAAARE